MPSALMWNCDLDLDLAARRAPQAGEHELAEQLVLLGAIALALEHEDLHRGLVVLDRREHVRLARRHRGVLLDQLVEVATDDHDAERVRRDVEEQDVALLVGERRALDRGAERDDLVGVHALARLEAEELGDRLLHARHARHAADEDHVLDLRSSSISASSSVRAQISTVRSMRSLGQLLELVARQHASAGAAPRCGPSR